jgi:hypothetical protein
MHTDPVYIAPANGDDGILQSLPVWSLLPADFYTDVSLLSTRTAVSQRTTTPADRGIWQLRTSDTTAVMASMISHDKHGVRSQEALSTESSHTLAVSEYISRWLTLLVCSLCSAHALDMFASSVFNAATEASVGLFHWLIKGLELCGESIGCFFCAFDLLLCLPSFSLPDPLGKLPVKPVTESGGPPRQKLPQSCLLDLRQAFGPRVKGGFREGIGCRSVGCS